LVKQEKKHCPIWLVFVCCANLFCALSWLTSHATVDALTEAYATPQADVIAVNGSCSDTPVTAFSPNLSYTLSFTSSQSGPATCNGSLGLGSPVNSDTAPTLGCNTTDVSGFAVMSSRMPTIKIGGLQCTTEDRATLEVHGDGSDNPAIDIALSTVDSTAWDASKKVDASTSSSKIMLFGPSGQVGTSAIVDGQDNDALTNGEVAFGGTTASQGGSRVYLKADYTGYDLQAATDKETLTFSITPQ